MFNIQQLIQAAEYLDRRERGEIFVKNVDNVRAFMLEMENLSFAT